MPPSWSNVFGAKFFIPKSTLKYILERPCISQALWDLCRINEISFGICKMNGINLGLYRKVYVFSGYEITTAMEAVQENEKGLLRKLEEFRVRPSKVTAELFYYALTTPVWQDIQRNLFVWFDVYSEIEASDWTTYGELKQLVTNVRQEDDARVVDTCRCFLVFLGFLFDRLPYSL